MKIIITENFDQMSQRAAQVIAKQINEKSDSVLGLATGSTPIGTYKELVKLFQAGTISFEKITTFNLDEYLGIAPTNPQSYQYFMKENLFSQVNLPEDHWYVPNGKAECSKTECFNYDTMIQDQGGLDLQLLGIGHNGHIGFNEPKEEFLRYTHVVSLDERTIEANARFFTTKEEVPTQAITMGILTIMAAKKVLLVISGKDKAEIAKQALQGEINPQVPASILQCHPDLTVILDKDAASLL